MYVEAIGAEGGRALLVPPSEQGVEETLDALDGLLFSGGSDLDPAVYGAEPHAETNGIRPRRDAGELALLRASLERYRPVVAVCRGSQVLNVALGGDLVQHLPDIVGDDKHKLVPGVFAEHEVDVHPDSVLGSLIGDRTRGKSHPPQGFARLGAGLRPVAEAEDGTIEALEDPKRRFALGVLWHPEAGDDARLFEEVVRQRARYRAARG